MRRGALVLCGGRSTRMGRDKASLPFGDEMLLQRVVRILQPIVHEIVVVGRPGQSLPPLPADVSITHDEILDSGPLGGLHAGLHATSADAVFATGCDVPFLEPKTVELLFDRVRDAQVAVVVEEGLFHPLTAVYRREILAHVSRLLRAGRRRPVFLYDLVSTVTVDAAELTTVDPALRSLANLNDEDAYDAALALLDQGEAT